MIELSSTYNTLIEKLHDETNVDKVVETYRANLTKLRNDIVAVEEALTKLVESGEIVKVEGTSYYDGSGFEFYGDMRLGHHFYIRVTADQRNYIDLSVKTKDGERSISWEENNVQYMISALESINYLRAVFANGTELFDLYINPFTSNVDNTPRENE